MTETKTHSEKDAKGAESDLLLKLADSINPFFRYYSRPRLLGVLVGIFMLIGLISMFIANVTCQEVIDTTVKYEAVSGTFYSQKAFIDAFTADPDDLPGFTQLEDDDIPPSL